LKVFPSIKIEGGLFSSDILEKIARAEIEGQRPVDFGLKPNSNLLDEIASVFADARKYWSVFSEKKQKWEEDEIGTSETRDLWMIPFFRLFGYDLEYNRRAYVIGDLSFSISHRAGSEENAPPVHIVGAGQKLGQVAASGRPRLSPHALVQEYLNRSDNVWGIVTNGLTIRLLRDSTYIRRQSYIEFDLQTIMEDQLFEDFAILYRLLHRSRLPKTSEDASQCLLEKYRQYTIEQGGRVRENLRDGVTECLKILGNGFLNHPKNIELRELISSSDNEQFKKQDFYQQLLRLVYRFLFLLVSEERGLISSDSVYINHYSISRLRKLVDDYRAYNNYDDLWQSLRVLWKVFGDEKLAKYLKASPLNGDLFKETAFDNFTISNRNLLEALWYLFYYRENNSSPPLKVNYSALDVEELGSVYESLLELEPFIDRSNPQNPKFDFGSGTQRRLTGSYYTPAELVADLVHFALDPVIEERLKNLKTKQEKEKAILSIKVCDPASGSGHFLLAAARRLGKELARIRTGEEEPDPEAIRESIRDVISHCIYGVDKNPLAVDLCKVALWLEAHCEGKPLTFLDHHIRCGDSLIGIAGLDALKNGIPDEAYQPLGKDDRALAGQAKKKNAFERKSLLYQHEIVIRRLSCFSEKLESILDEPEGTVEELRAKYTAYHHLKDSPDFRRLLLAANVWTAAFFQPYNSEHIPLTTTHVQDALSRGTLLDSRQNGYLFQTELEYRFFHWALEFVEVFNNGGFDVIIGNPPFLGGLKISGAFGIRYRNYLKYAYKPFGGTADLCAAFYRRAFSLLKPGGRLGMVATNTMGQGDTRESGLAVILRQGGVITFAKRFIKWPGAANVEVNLIAIHKPDERNITTRCLPILDGQQVDFISSRLDAEPESEPVRLRQNEGRAFQGDIVRGIGFVLEQEEAERLLFQNPRNANCLFPYLNGDDLNSHPEQRPSRYVICFHDWELERARQYPELLRIVEERVKPERDCLTGLGDNRNREYWWQFGAYRSGMREAIVPLQRVLARSRVSELHAIVFVPKGYVYGDATVVFAFDDEYHFALLQSNIHEVWLRKQASSLRTDIRYTPTDCFDTFPFPPIEYEYMAKGKFRLEDMPQIFQKAAQIGAAYHEHRRQVMLTRQFGLTKTYNLFHNPDCQDADIIRLRELHIEMDRAILLCYGWDDLNLGHDFHKNDRGQIRFTVSPEARRELLRRLIDLNLKLSGE
jgi:hypothetical protein